MNRDLLTKLRDVIEDIKKLPLYTSYEEAELAEEPGVLLSQFNCGTSFCVLGWAVQRPEFQEYISFGYGGDGIRWSATQSNVEEALGISTFNGNYLFGESPTLDDRLNLVRELLHES